MRDEAVRAWNDQGEPWARGNCHFDDLDTDVQDAIIGAGREGIKLDPLGVARSKFLAAYRDPNGRPEEERRRTRSQPERLR